MPIPRPTPRRILVITGSRADYGLLRPVMFAIKARPKLHLQLAVAGEHLLAPAHTWRDAARDFRIDARIPMQRPRERTRLQHASATARGMSGFAAAYTKLKPDWVVVLGDRIEAFAAASAASIAGIAVCHIHGGDRAEGIADEAMRHAITKLAHLHCAATRLSAQRIIQMGEDPRHVHATGSPAIDGLKSIKPMSNADARRLGDPRAIVLLHPAGLPLCEEERWACEAVARARESLNRAQEARRNSVFRNILLLAPNSDPGRDIILRVWRFSRRHGAHFEGHLPRPAFLSLLARTRDIRGCLIGNSSAGLIEAAALGVPTLNLGPRQAGRDHGANVTHLDRLDEPVSPLAMWSLKKNMRLGLPRSRHFGDGRAGPRIARLLELTLPDPLLRKRNSY